MLEAWRWLACLCLYSHAYILCEAAPFHLQWYAPFFAPGGFGSEAMSYMLPLYDAFQSENREADVSLVNFALPVEPQFFEGLPSEYQRKLLALARNGVKELRNGTTKLKIIVCHSTPDYWYPSTFEGWDEVAPCPPQDRKKLFKVGRTMYETDRFPVTWFEKYQDFDEIWVPTKFHYGAILRDDLIDAAKVKVVPQAVDTDLFRPMKVSRKGKTFRFLSVFKWERRKGWDVLLRAFIEEFDADKDDVELVIKTSEFHMDEPIINKIQAWAKQEGLEMRNTRLRLLQNDVPMTSLPKLYAQHDAFVIASRGEGWCRPLAESMAAGLPAIATNFSGMTEFMTAENSFPITVAEMEAVPGMEGHFWAKPSTTHLRKVMRYVSEHVEEAKSKGKKGRRVMEQMYSFRVVAKNLLDRMKGIANSVSFVQRTAGKEDL